MTRKLPNILITGTPGCGKTQHCERLKELLNFKFFNVSEDAKEKGYHFGHDEEYDTYILDVEKVLDVLEDPIADGGCVVDYHTCDFFPERFFQLVVVLRCNNTTLYDRLEARGYNEKKLEENVEAEIMQVVEDSATESYAPEVVVVLNSETSEELEDNCQRIIAWIKGYMSQPAADED
jgi:adenylate kinase